MTNINLIEELEKAFKEKRNPPTLKEFLKNKEYTKEDLNQQAYHFLQTNLIEIQDVLQGKYSEQIIFKTNLGSFLFLMPGAKDLTQLEVLVQLEKLKHQKIDMVTFFNALDSEDPSKFWRPITFKNDTSFQISQAQEFIDFYYLYKMLKEPKYAKRLFNQTFDFYLSLRNKFIPLEYYDNKEFCNPSFQYSQISIDYFQKSIDYFQRIYELAPFSNNFTLMFLVAIYEKTPNIKFEVLKRKDELKKEVMQYFKTTPNSCTTAKICQFLQENNLFSEFTEEELTKLYIAAPIRFFKTNPTLFVKIAEKIPNTSPTIQLTSTSEEIVHITYHDYDLFKGKPTFKKKESISLEEHNKKADFINLFLHNNKVVTKLYKTYYKGYLKFIKNNPTKNNLEDFIACLLTPNNLYQIVNDPNFTINEVNQLFNFRLYYGKKTEEGIKKVNTISRQNQLSIYNKIIQLKDDKQALTTYLHSIHLTQDSYYSLIIQNRFLFQKEKSALIRILNMHYKNCARVMDILILLDEMAERELTIGEILKEKEIDKKDFQKIYDDAAENNPILYQCIFEKLSQNKRRGFLKIVRLSDKVIHANLNSREEYNHQFGQTISFEKLLQSLSETELCEKLVTKAQTWPDFDTKKISNLIKPKRKTKTLLSKRAQSQEEQ